MKRFLFYASLCATAFCAAPCRVQSQPADGPQLTVREASGDVAIVVRTLRWMPYEEFAPGDKLWGDARARVLALEYQVVPEASWKGLGGRNFDIQLEAHDDRGNVGRSLGSTQGDRARCAWYNLDPRASKITFEWRLQHPDVPAQSRRERSHAIEWRDVPLPASWAGISEQRDAGWPLHGFEATTPLGTRVVLDSLGRWSSNTPDPGDDRMSLNFSLFPSGKIDGLKSSVRTRTGQIIDSTGRDLMTKGNATGFSSTSPEAGSSGRASGSLILLNMPAPGATTLRVRLDAIDESPALSDPKWRRDLKLEADGKTLQWTPEPDPPAPVAQGKGEQVNVIVDSIKSNGARGNYANRQVRLWLKPAATDAATDAAATPSWQLKKLEVRSGGRSQIVDDLERRSGSSNHDLMWHADGTPARPGESGLEFTIPILAEEANAGGNPATADFVLTATCKRRVVREFMVSGLAFPSRPGAALEPGLAFEHADGSRLIVRRVGLLGRGSVPAKAEKIVVAMEFRPAHQAAPSEKAKFSFSAGEPREENGIYYPSVPNGNLLSATSGQSGDAWPGLISATVTRDADGRATITPGASLAPTDAASAGRKLQFWYTAFFEVSDAAIEALSFKVRVVEAEETGAETITLNNVPLPAP